MEKIPVVLDYILCWPMKVDFVCNIGEQLGAYGGENGICDPSNIVDDNFGKDFVELKQIDQELMTDVNISQVQISDIQK